MNLPTGQGSPYLKWGAGVILLFLGTGALVVAINLILTPLYVLNPAGAAATVAFLGRSIVLSSTIETIAGTAALFGVPLAAVGAWVLGSSKGKTKSRIYLGLLAIGIALFAFSMVASPAFADNYVAQSAQSDQPYGGTYSEFVQVVQGSGGPYYLAQNGTTGEVDYGGPGNLGGAAGTSPSTVINDAMANGGKIVLGVGTFTMSATASQILVSTKNENLPTTLTGMGWKTIINGPSGYNAVFIRVSNDNTIVSNMKVDCTGSSKNTADVAAVELYGANDTVSGVETLECGNDVALGGQSTAKYDTITNNFILDTANGISTDTGSGIELQGNYMTVTDNHIENTGGACIVTTGGSLSLISGNTCINAGTEHNTAAGISVNKGLSNQPSTNDTISDNIISTSGGNGIAIAGASGHVATGIFVLDNQILYPSLKGIYVDGYTSNFLIEGNFIKSKSTSGGIIFQGTADTEGTVANNYCDFESGIAGNCVDLTATYVTVTGNTGVDGNYGVRERAGSDYNTIVGNDFASGLKWSHSVGSLVGVHDIVEANIGYNPVKAITGAFDDNAGLNINDTGGGKATPANSTTLTNIWSPKLICLIQGATDSTGEKTTVKVDGSVILNAVVLSAGYTLCTSLSPGETYFATWHTGDASWIVSGQ